VIAFSRLIEMLGLAGEGRSRRGPSSLLAAMLGRGQLPRRNELAALRPATRVLMTGLASWIVLVVLLTIVALLYTQFSQSGMSGWLGAREASPRSGLVRDTSTFDNIAQRPLFSRARQANQATQPVVLSAAPPPMLDQSITLRGVFMSEGVAKAFLVTTQNPVGVWVPVDGELDGWRVVGVDPGQVMLDGGQNQRLTLPLTVNGNASR